MEGLLEWLPKIASGIVFLIGVICFFRPRLIMDSCGIQMTNTMAISEVRGVFGGLNLGGAIAAFYFADPMIYTALGVSWLCVTAARFYSMLVDGSTLKESIAPIVLDSSVALLFLSGSGLF